MKALITLCKGFLAASVTAGMLSGCGAFSKPPKASAVAVVPAVKVVPPADLMKDCPHAAKPTSKTNGGLAEGIKSERNALDICNKQLGALRTWSAETTKPSK